MNKINSQDTDTGSDNTADEEFDLRMNEVEKSVLLYHEYLIKYVFRLCHHNADSENLVAELWRYCVTRMRLESIGNLKILRTKLYFLWLDLYRTRKRNREHMIENYSEIPTISPPYQPLSEGEETELEIRFWDSLPGVQLSDNQKKTIYLHARFEKTIAEISSELNIPRSTVGDYIRRAGIEIANVLNNEGRV